MDMNALLGSMGPIKDAMAKEHEARSGRSFIGNAGGGAVEVKLRGDLLFENIRITPAAIAACENDAEMVEDLILAACNDAIQKYKQAYGANPEEQMQKLMSQCDLSSMLGGLMGGMGGGAPS